VTGKIKFIKAGREVSRMDSSVERGKGEMARGMDEKIEAAAEMGGREEDTGAREK
jgi:hypothetical protein